MKAAIAYAPGSEDVLKYEDVSDPQCGPGEVRIRIRSSSINRGDTSRRAGSTRGAAIQWPLIIGWDIAGEVESVGPGVLDRKVGERVVALIPNGGYAELATAPAGDAVPVPDNVSFDEAAALPVAYLTAWYGLLHRARLAPGDVALIQAGASGVGVGAIQMAKNAGATVISTAGTRKKVDACLDLGADHGVNYVEQDFVDEVRRITGGRGADVVLEQVGGETLVKSMEALAPFGRLVSVGNTSRQTAMVDATDLLSRRCEVSGLGVLTQSNICPGSWPTSSQRWPRAGSRLS